MLIKGGKYREVLSSVDTFMFDKAETLVEESFQVAKVRSMGAIPKSACSEIVACAEASSKHPLALSLRQAYGKKIDRSKIFEVSKVAGQEIRAKIAKSLVLVGTSKLMGAHKISYEVDAAPYICLHCY
jgi:Cd2+/Zn2+-exporting ATPase